MTREKNETSDPQKTTGNRVCEDGDRMRAGDRRRWQRRSGGRWGKGEWVRENEREIEGRE